MTTELDFDDMNVSFNFLKREMSKIDPAMFALADRVIGDADPSDDGTQVLLISEWMALEEGMCTLLIHLAVNHGVAMSRINRNIKCRAKTSRCAERAIRALQRTDDGQRMLDSLRVKSPALAA